MAAYLNFNENKASVLQGDSYYLVRVFHFQMYNNQFV